MYMSVEKGFDRKMVIIYSLMGLDEIENVNIMLFPF